MSATQFKPGDRVRYVPGHAYDDIRHHDCEDGAISSVSDLNTCFVKFDKAVARFGWDGTIAQGCYPFDLVKISIDTPAIRPKP